MTNSCSPHGKRIARSARVLCAATALLLACESDEVFGLRQAVASEGAEVIASIGSDSGSAAKSGMSQQPMTADIAEQANMDNGPSDAPDIEKGVPPYRPFASRFELKQQNESSPAFAMPENRRAYRRFVYEHPRHGMSPTSSDTNAESNAVFVFVFAAFAMVLCAILASDRLQYLSPEKQGPVIMAAGFVPWFIASTWVSHVALRHFWHPIRYGLMEASEDECEWQCNGLVYYLLLLPIFTGLAGVSQVMKIRHIPEGVEAGGKQASMGRMFDNTFSQEAVEARHLGVRFGNALAQPAVRYTLLALAGICLLAGIILVCFGGRGSEFCQPEVWWTSVLLVIITFMAMVLVALSTLGCYLVFHIARSPWLQDFVDSFSRKPREF